MLVTEVEIVGIQVKLQTTTCTGVEMFRKLLDEGRAGENIGALLRGTKREDVERGQVLAAPGSITPHTRFERRSVRTIQRRGWSSYSFLQRLPSTVLLPYNGYHRCM